MDLAKLFSGIDYSEIKWVQKERCGFCEKERLNQTYAQYLQRGNICNKCSSKILEKHIKKIYEKQQEKNNKVQDHDANQDEQIGETLEQEIV